MKFVPIELSEANGFVTYFHRHNKPVKRAKFQIGLMEGSELIGIAIVGRPVARLLADGHTLEVLRVCVKEGHHNACSKLYARCRQISQLLGYDKVITYTLKTESGSSLKALFARPVAETTPQSWSRKGRFREEHPVYKIPKIRWEL